MNLKYLLTLAGRLSIYDKTILNETISSDPEVNRDIEAILAQTSPENQSRYLAALESLQESGSAGLTFEQWVAAYRQYRMPTEEPDAEQLVKTVSVRFSGLAVEMLRDRYRFIDGAKNMTSRADYTSDPDIEPMMKDAITNHVEISSEMMKHAQATEIFTLQSLARVAIRVGVPNSHAMMYATVFVDHHRGMIEQLGNGDMTIRAEDRKKQPKMSRQDYSDMFKGFANNAKRDLGDDE